MQTLEKRLNSKPTSNRIEVTEEGQPFIYEGKVRNLIFDSLTDSLMGEARLTKYRKIPIVEGRKRLLSSDSSLQPTGSFKESEAWILTSDNTAYFIEGGKPATDEGFREGYRGSLKSAVAGKLIEVIDNTDCRSYLMGGDRPMQNSLAFSLYTKKNWLNPEWLAYSGVATGLKLDLDPQIIEKVFSPIDTQLIGLYNQSKAAPLSLSNKKNEVGYRMYASMVSAAKQNKDYNKRSDGGVSDNVGPIRVIKMENVGGQYFITAGVNDKNSSTDFLGRNGHQIIEVGLDLSKTGEELYHYRAPKGITTHMPLHKFNSFQSEIFNYVKEFKLFK